MEDLIRQFTDRYLTRQEIAYRLPVSVPISAFWPKLLAAREQAAIPLPLRDQRGNTFWFVLNKSIEQNADAVAAMARRDVAFEKIFGDTHADALIDEAVWSSVIEGAFTSKAEAVKMILRDKAPVNRSEQMVKNNYEALMYVLDHLEEPISRQMLTEIASILTKHASEETVTDYRTVPVYVTGRDGIVYTPPSAEDVPSMMDALIAFINDSDLHPVLKACAAHFYFVYVHPFTDGNGRTARALSYMILLRTGYDFFRYLSISGLIAEERSRYYRAMVNVEDSRNGKGDMTYFIDYYTSMLARVVGDMESHLTHHVLAASVKEHMEAQHRFAARLIEGMTWLIENDFEHVTVEQWRKKFGTVTETARKDLLTLAGEGLLERTTEGRKAVFRVLRKLPEGFES